MPPKIWGHKDGHAPKAPTLIAIAVVLIAGGVGAMFAWGAGRDGVIANDVRVGPVEVGDDPRAGARGAHRPAREAAAPARSSSGPPAGRFR